MLYNFIGQNSERCEVMKYKILMNGGYGSQLVKDIFQHTDFTCLSTSDIWEDVTAHMDIFKPDAYICFPEHYDDGAVDRLKTLRITPEYKGVKYVIAADTDICSQVSQRLPTLSTSVLMIKLPTTYRLVERQVVRFLESRGTPAGGAGAAVPQGQASGMGTASGSGNSGSSLPDLGLGISLDDLKLSFAAEETKKRILVVDDDRSVLKMLKTALSEKYDVTTMVNGKMAEKYLETKDADLILLDYEMPEETGAEVFKKLRLKLKVKKIPVIFLTGVADSEKIKEVLALKPKGYLLKPINMERLMASIKDAVGD